MTDLEKILSSLPRQQPDKVQAARLRATCHRALVRRPTARPLAPAAVVGACVVYLSAVIHAVMTFYGF